MVTACAISGNSDKSVDIPPLSKTAKKGGTLTPWITETLTPQNTPTFLGKVRASEVMNARAARACKAEYGNLQKLFVEKQ